MVSCVSRERNQGTMKDNPGLFVKNDLVDQIECDRRSKRVVLLEVGCSMVQLDVRVRLIMERSKLERSRKNWLRLVCC